MERPCKGLTVAEVIEANRRLTAFAGGNHGILNPGSLEHTFEQVQGSIFGKQLYPTVTNKAAFLCHRIAQGHFFFDGNKRTAFWTCKTTLHQNGLRLAFSHDEVFEIMVKIAKKQMELAELEDWIIRRLPLR
ncbi:type II toxin-antitoxin system death-on-curing family toxin [Solidesulfovibrio sp.]